MTDPLFTSILVSGADARSFLQGQLSCDMDTVSRDKSLLASLNSAQGRVQAVLNLIERDDGIVLSVVSAMADRTVQRLRKYVLRSKVKIETLLSAHPVTAMEGGNAGNAGAFFSEPVEGFRPSLIAGQEHFDRLSASGPENILLSQIRSGLPHVFPETHEAFVAQMLNLDVLGGISFEKGCYTGQEIIARAHFRGAVKRRMFRFAANGSPPTPGTRLLSNGEHAGDVVYAAATEDGCELLAVVSLAHADAVLTIDGASDTLEKLSLPHAIT
jgi:folate-binding protein YgfZ